MVRYWQVQILVWTSHLQKVGAGMWDFGVRLGSSVLLCRNRSGRVLWTWWFHKTAKGIGQDPMAWGLEKVRRKNAWGNRGFGLFVKIASIFEYGIADSRFHLGSTHFPTSPEYCDSSVTPAHWMSDKSELEDDGTSVVDCFLSCRRVSGSLSGLSSTSSSTTFWSGFFCEMKQLSIQEKGLHSACNDEDDVFFFFCCNDWM